MKTGTWIAGAVLTLIAAAPVDAQQGASWTAWQGCWTPEGDGAAGEVVCMAPAAEAAAVRVVTLRDGVIASETTVRADGVARAVTEGGCTGTERAEFSADGRRVYTRADLTCDGVSRVSTGVMAVLTEVEWVESQAVGVGEQYAVRTTRYRAAATPAAMAMASVQPMAVEAARLHAAAPLETSDVIEATRLASAPAVEAFLATRQQGFALDAKRLLALRDAGVPQSTIDVMVALSYPARFAVKERRASAPTQEAGMNPLLRDPRFARQACYDRTWSREYGASTYGYENRFDRYYAYEGQGDCYRRRGYGYSPWGYDSFGWNYHDRSRPVVVIVDPGQPTEDETPIIDGRVVKGRGYTSGNGASTGEATPRGRSTTSRPARVTDTSSSVPAMPKAGATSNGGGSTEPARTGRAAKPRGGGN